MKFATLVSSIAVAAARTHDIDCKEWFKFSESNESNWSKGWYVNLDGY